MENRRILIVDDNRSIHDDFRKILAPAAPTHGAELDAMEQVMFGTTVARISASEEIAYEIDSAYQGEEAYQMVRKAASDGRPYALVFMDVRMPPGWDGVETIARVWRMYPNTEIVMCTAFSDYSWEEIIQRLGASDHLLFLRKPFDATAVRQMALTLTRKWNLNAQARVHVAELEREARARAVRLDALLDEVNRKTRELDDVVLRDSLTGLPNRATFSDRLQQGIRRAAREQQELAVLVLDLDRFKEVIDVHGRRVADGLLQEVSRLLRAELRDSDTVAFLGGDEFALVLHDVNRVGAIVVARKINALLERPLLVDGHGLNVGATVGIALYPEHGSDDADLLKNADLAVNDARHNGAGYAVFDVAEFAQRAHRQKLLQDLKHAIENGGLALYYQPVIDLATRRIIGVEALTRWIHPQHGFIRPDEFIPMAEQKGLIHPLTIWVTETALAQCAQWQAAGLNLGVAVNLSMRNLLDTRLLARLDRALRTHSVDPALLSLEITESVAMHDPERTLEMIRAIDQMGVRISIDDFGTGYSSLSYLKKLPVDELKIDRSFVLDMDTDDDNRVIVQSTVDLAHTLGLKVVAEGIENETVLNLLAHLKCDKVQGYYLCKPKPAEELDQWLRESPWAFGAKVALRSA